jgi:hypothetical protein
VTRNCN